MAQSEYSAKLKSMVILTILGASQSREALQKKWKQTGSQTLWVRRACLSSFARILLFSHPLLVHETAVSLTGPGRGMLHPILEMRN